MLSSIAPPAQARTPKPPKLTKAQIGFWQRLHRCEQPSSWHGGFPRYPGGLGIYVTTWAWGAGELGLLARYPNGAAAPPYVQMQVAQYGYERHRWFWVCFRHVGYPVR